MLVYKKEYVYKYLPWLSLCPTGKIFACIVAMLACYHPANAQQRYKVQCRIPNYSGNTIFKENENYDSVTIINKTRDFLNQRKKEGYIFSNLDKMDFQKDSCFIDLFIGTRWFWIWKDSFSSTSAYMQKEILRSVTTDSGGISQLGKIALAPYVNNGYPFASLNLKTIPAGDDSLQVYPTINSGKYMVYDTLRMSGSLKVSKSFLQLYLDIVPGRPYNHSRILELSKLINDLPFAITDTLPVLYFYNNKTIVQLFAGQKQASRFDFIIGLAPATGNSGFTVNGELTADLVNKFSRGESLGIRFKRLSLDDQSLQVNLTYPYLLGTRFGFDGSFGINRNRSLSIDASGSAGLQFMVSGSKTIKLLWTSRSSRLTDVDTVTIKNQRRLPSVLDYNLNGLSVSYLTRNLDYRFNPRTGYELEIQANAGIRKFISNTSITEIKDEITDFSMAYDSLKESRLQSTLSLNASIFRPIKNWAVVKLQLTGSTIIQKGKEIENEAFRLGGFKGMRGFQELSIITRSYVMFTAEGRVIIDRNSYLSFPFIDIARMKVTSNGNTTWKTAAGIGVGLNFSTRAGIFNFTLAAGNNFNGFPAFSNTLVHFGYLNVF